MDYAGKFFKLGSGQIGAVDHPVIVVPAVEAIFFPTLLGSIIPLASFSLGTGWGFLLVGVFVDAAAAAAAVAAANLPFCAKAMPPLEHPRVGTAGRRIYIGLRAGGPCHRCRGWCPNL